MRFTTRFLYLGLFFFLSNTILSQNKLDTLKVLFVGNSYTYYSDLPQLTSLISNHTKVKLVTKSSVTGGANLNHHWNGERGLKTKDIIKSGNFDIVILQEQSLGTIQNANRFLGVVKKFSTFIRQHGAKPYLYTTWAREKKPQQQKTITRVYKQAARDNNAGIVLAGEAWALARKQNSNIDLYIEDGSHPSSLGAFLTACLFVNTISKELPNELPNKYNITNDLGDIIEARYYNSSDISFCLKVVKETER
ncbi:hypothetical protein D7030_10845 [Flavobacteriaceae bacterium AU392]|nr:hypothetical protein D1817_13825 [Flavobacteriaceae bacterium]RKM82659.1 hypothetical protein D7030_10845 [Flavobacteriaceae bacterium AU392]